MVLVEAMKAYSAPKANNLKDTKLDLKTFCSDLAACRDIHKSFPSGPDRVGVVDLMIRANPEAAKSCPKSFDRIETPSTGKPGTSAID
jgi:hypothetical protein